MARTVAIIQAEIDALKAARATGALRVRFREREVEYRSMKDINDAIAALERELDELNGVTPIRHFHFLATKGI